MDSIYCTLLIGGLLVAIATAAPVSNEEKLVSVNQAEESVDRAKRADEEIVFGNQQNQARVMAKKSDLSNVIAPPQPQGEQDLGSEVIVHKEMPIDAALDARAEAALDRAGQENKMSQAVEAAMQSVAQLDEDAQDEENTAAETETSSEEVENAVAENGEDDATDAVAALEEAGESDEDDEDLQELQKANTQVTEDAVETDDNAANEEMTGNDGELSSQQPKADEVDQFLQELQKQGGGNGLDLSLPNAADKSMNNYYQNMYRLMMTPYAGQEMLQRLPYIYYRRRRSPASAQNANQKRARRIKRDLLDDSYYSPYDLNTVPYYPVNVNDALISDPDEYVPLTDEETEYLYKRLITYLANNYAEEEDQEDPYEELAPQEPYEEGYEDSLQGEPYSPYEAYGAENVPQVSSPYDDGYPYGPVDLDTYTNYAKRDMADYYPQIPSKRYFFPFNEEPETHWGAFVPEKRNYDEAIQRLQRLAMALSDNPGPYYREMLEDYRRK